MQETRHTSDVYWSKALDDASQRKNTEETRRKRFPQNSNEPVTGSAGLGKARRVKLLLRGSCRQVRLRPGLRAGPYLNDGSFEFDSRQHMAAATEAVFISVRWNRTLLS